MRPRAHLSKTVGEHRLVNPTQTETFGFRAGAPVAAILPRGSVFLSVAGGYSPAFPGRSAQEGVIRKSLLPPLCGRAKPVGDDPRES